MIWPEGRTSIFSLPPAYPLVFALINVYRYIPTRVFARAPPLVFVAPRQFVRLTEQK